MPLRLPERWATGEQSPVVAVLYWPNWIFEPRRRFSLGPGRTSRLHAAQGESTRAASQPGYSGNDRLGGPGGWVGGQFVPRRDCEPSLVQFTHVGSPRLALLAPRRAKASTATTHFHTVRGRPVDGTEGARHPVVPAVPPFTLFPRRPPRSPWHSATFCCRTRRRVGWAVVAAAPVTWAVESTWRTSGRAVSTRWMLVVRSVGTSLVLFRALPYQGTGISPPW